MILTLFGLDHFELTKRPIGLLNKLKVAHLLKKIYCFFT
jgi:hypothetical protein